MNAVFTGNPYKCWNRGAEGELHIFEYEGMGKEFARLNDICLCECPNDWWESGSWFGLVEDWMDFGGDVVLHYFTDERDDGDFEEWVFECVRNNPIPGATVDFRYENDGKWVTADVHLPNWAKFGPTHTDRSKTLMGLMFDLYDVWPIEFWDGEECTGDCIEYAA